MKSSAATVPAYLASLTADRRAALSAVRAVIRRNLGEGYQEAMVWGVAAVVVKRSIWPAGHHTDPGKPLMMCGFSSQKNDMVIYMLNIHRDKALREWFSAAWEKTGRRLHMSVEAGGGCCIRFRRLEDLDLDIIGESIRRTPAVAYIDTHVQLLERRGGTGKRGAKKKPAPMTARKKKSTRSARARKTPQR